VSSRSYVRLLKILVITFPIIVGSVATLYGVILYSNTQIFYPEDRAIPPGILIFSSMEMSSVNFSMQIVEVNFELGRSDKTMLQCDFDVASPLTGEQTIGLQFPYIIEKLEAYGSDFQVSKIEIIPETFSPGDGARQTEATIVYLKFEPKPELHYSIRVLLSWSGFLSHTDYATYKFVVPFARNEAALRNSIDNLLPNAKIRYVTQREGDHVSLMMNAAADIKLVYPTPSSVMGIPGYNNQMLVWDLSYPYSISISEELGSMADTVVVYFELGSLAEQRNSYLFGAGIYTGLGVSLIFSGIHEALKYLGETRVKK
jgi:hypothetical protein